MENNNNQVSSEIINEDGRIIVMIEDDSPNNNEENLEINLKRIEDDSNMLTNENQLYCYHQEKLKEEDLEKIKKYYSKYGKIMFFDHFIAREYCRIIFESKENALKAYESGTIELGNCRIELFKNQPERIVNIKVLEDQSVMDKEVKLECSKHGIVNLYNELQKGKEFMIGFRNLISAKDAVLKIKEIEGKKVLVDFPGKTTSKKIQKKKHKNFCFFFTSGFFFF